MLYDGWLLRESILAGMVGYRKELGGPWEPLVKSIS
jgi:hypothetical protein